MFKKSFMESKVTLIWFRNDLRFHDNEILFETVSKSPIIIPVYCFDPRYFSKNQVVIGRQGFTEHALFWMR